MLMVDARIVSRGVCAAIMALAMVCLCVNSAQATATYDARLQYEARIQAILNDQGQSIAMPTDLDITLKIIQVDTIALEIGAADANVSVDATWNSQAVNLGLDPEEGPVTVGQYSGTGLVGVTGQEQSFTAQVGGQFNVDLRCWGHADPPGVSLAYSKAQFVGEWSIENASQTQTYTIRFALNHQVDLTATTTGPNESAEASALYGTFGDEDQALFDILEGLETDEDFNNLDPATQQALQALVDRMNQFSVNSPNGSEHETIAATFDLQVGPGSDGFANVERASYFLTDEGIAIVVPEPTPIAISVLILAAISRRRSRLSLA